MIPPRGRGHACGIQLRRSGCRHDRLRWEHLSPCLPHPRGVNLLTGNQVANCSPTRKAERLLLSRPGSYFEITAARNRSRGCWGESWRRLLQFCRINSPFPSYCSPRGGAAASPVPVSALLNIWKGVELTKLLQDSSLATISMSLVKHFKNINELT